MFCNQCISYDVCGDKKYYESPDNTIMCSDFKNKANFVEVVRCKDCKYSRLLNKMKSPEKYYKDSCIVCECEDVVGDEPMIYPRIHFCGYGERRDA